LFGLLLLLFFFSNSSFVLSSFSFFCLHFSALINLSLSTCGPPSLFELSHGSPSSARELGRTEASEQKQKYYNTHHVLFCFAPFMRHLATKLIISVEQSSSLCSLGGGEVGTRRIAIIGCTSFSGGTPSRISITVICKQKERG
jgi:hypothetical protein